MGVEEATGACTDAWPMSNCCKDRARTARRGLGRRSRSSAETTDAHAELARILEPAQRLTRRIRASYYKPVPLSQERISSMLDNLTMRLDEQSRLHASRRAAPNDVPRAAAEVAVAPGPADPSEDPPMRSASRYAEAPKADETAAAESTAAPGPLAQRSKRARLEPPNPDRQPDSQQDPRDPVPQQTPPA